MAASSPRQITCLLVQWSHGDHTALEELVPLVRCELRRLAKCYVRRKAPGHSLYTSDLVNEAYVRLIDAKNISWQDRAHFFGVAAHLMRQILMDHARRYRYAKRGGGTPKVSLDEGAEVCKQPAAELMALDDALTGLAAFDQRKSRVVELRFFGGLSTEEAAEVLGISPRTVAREWRIAKAWLHREISRD
ncbi:MAG: sigma-70 family RNA polymerase sigma factor [Acidobacteria bacterium]|nr:sigma-70 family RNA polymerase sigma factor [Acidobacteriota bacterium]